MYPREKDFVAPEFGDEASDDEDEDNVVWLSDTSDGKPASCTCSKQGLNDSLSQPLLRNEEGTAVRPTSSQVWEAHLEATKLDRVAFPFVVVVQFISYKLSIYRL